MNLYQRNNYTACQACSKSRYFNAKPDTVLASPPAVPTAQKI